MADYCQIIPLELGEPEQIQPELMAEYSVVPLLALALLPQLARAPVGSVGGDHLVLLVLVVVHLGRVGLLPVSGREAVLGRADHHRMQLLNCHLFH